MWMLRPVRCFTGPHSFIYILHHASWLSKKPHFRGLRTTAVGYDPKFELGRDFCMMHLPPKFHHPVFTGSEVIMLTNKPTQKQTNRCRRKHPTFFTMLRCWVKMWQFITAGLIWIMFHCCSDAKHYSHWQNCYENCCIYSCAIAGTSTPTYVNG